jgi:sulfur carrier protein
VNVVVNGDTVALEAGITVAGLVAIVASSPKGLAVAVNEEVVPRSTWAGVALRPDDRVEVLTPSQGG